MRRQQLIELEDLDWFPAAIRDGGTASLRAIGKMINMGRFLAPPLADALKRSGERRLIDLCSGGAGPLPEVLSWLRGAGLEVEALLTDKYPNHAALSQIADESGGQVSFSQAPVDATDVRFAEFAVPAAVDGVIAIDGAPATLTESGAAAFGTYPAGEEFDPVTATIPVSGDCAIAPAAVAEGGEAAAAGAAVTPISAQEAPLWPWIVGGGVLLLVAAGVTVMVISRRRQGTSA